MIRAFRWPAGTVCVFACVAPTRGHDSHALSDTQTRHPTGLEGLTRKGAGMVFSPAPATTRPCNKTAPLGRDAPSLAPAASRRFTPQLRARIRRWRVDNKAALLQQSQVEGMGQSLSWERVQGHWFAQTRGVLGMG